MTYLISYDISNTKKRTKLSKFLENKGRRLQKSLFVLELKKNRLRGFKKDIELIMVKEGDILIIPLCRGSIDKVEKFGTLDHEYLIF